MPVLRHANLIVALLILFGAANIVGTYQKLSHVFDEIAHIGTGMQWWSQNEYSHEPLHPPLARLMAASLLFVVGKEDAVAGSDEDYWFQGLDILHAHGDYVFNLILMRLGVLPFYLISCLLVYSWSRQLFGVPAALLSLGMYVTLPTVAAHAGLATTDMGGATMLMAGIMASLRWLKQPGLFNSVLAGVVLALMVAAKFSNVFYWPVAMAAMAVLNCMVVFRRLPGAPVFSIGLRHMRWAVVVSGFFLLVLAALYLFSYQPLIDGFQQVLDKNKSGHATWLFRPLNNAGVWYFFPVVYFFKTPIAFLCANILALGRVVRRIVREQKTVESVFPIIAVLAIFAVNMPSDINIGVRHALAVYPMMAVVSGYGLLWLWRQKHTYIRRLFRLSLIALAALQAYDFLDGFPDRISYYNQPARWITGGHPEHISFDSDLDWGQQYLQLAEAIKKRHITHLYTCFWLNGFIRRMDQTLGLKPDGCPSEKITGWIAVGRAEKLLSQEKLQWLDAYQPVDSVGNTLWLYYID
ncbi:MAG: hypothetical protein SFX19_07815 [Alphaproteobacteria bacterium]|nr:hypothetical protein [Alphaproteobacteria bacterium]